MAGDFEYELAGARVRRGRRVGPVAEGTISAEVRQRRDALGLTLREAAALTGVSPTVICEVERGRRTPSVRTYARLRDGLGMTAPPSALVPVSVHVPLEDRHLATLAACVVSARGATLADLGSALQVSIPAVREGLSVLGDRLSAVGLRVVDDGVVVRVAPLAFAHDAVAAVTSLEEAPRLSDEQVSILCVVAYAGSATRRRIEEVRGEECETVLRRLVDRGLLEATRDDQLEHAPNLYRLTAKALGAMGYPTLEALQQWLAEQMSADP